MTRTQFAVALAVLFAGGVVGGVLSDHVRGGTVAWAQEDGKPMQIDSLVVNKLLVLDGLTVADEKARERGDSVMITPSGLTVRHRRSSVHLWALDYMASLSLDSSGSGDPLADLLETDKERQFYVITSADGFSLLRLNGLNTNEGIRIGQLPEMGPRIWLMDRLGEIRVTIGPNDNGRWEVGVWKVDGRGRTLEAGD